CILEEGPIPTVIDLPHLGGKRGTETSQFRRLNCKPQQRLLDAAIGLAGEQLNKQGLRRAQKGATTSPCVTIRWRSACRHVSLEVRWPRRAIKGDRLSKAERLLADGARNGHCSTRKRDHPDHGGSGSVRCRLILFS